MRRPLHVLSAAAVALALTACGTDDTEPVPSDAAAPGAGEGRTVSFVDDQGTEVGTADVVFADDGATLVVDVRGLDPGFHGLHVHESGQCEPDSASSSDPSKTGAFLSAGGHLAAGDEDHGEHTGDLPPLLVTADGTASTTVASDRLRESDVLDADGSAIMVHAGPDNLGNIPERYAASGPDEMTLGTGDSGGRVACAVLAAG